MSTYNQLVLETLGSRPIIITEMRERNNNFQIYAHINNIIQPFVVHN
jgi:hypothetical protein